LNCDMSKSCFFFSSRRRHTRFSRDWSSDVCSSDLGSAGPSCKARCAQPQAWLRSSQHWPRANRQLRNLDTALMGPQSAQRRHEPDRKSTRLNSSHVKISYAVFCLKKKKDEDHKPTT